jgi:hypothetical protein
MQNETPTDNASQEAQQEERLLSADEGWDLIFQSFGSGKGLFAKFGGGEALLRGERTAWGVDQSQHAPVRSKNGPPF